jgi:hypothetical protein
MFLRTDSIERRPLSTLTCWEIQFGAACMPRNNAVIIQTKNVDAKVQAIPRSERAHLKQSAQNCPTHPQKTTTARGSYLPEPKILRIQQRYLNGENKTEIARKEKCDRETVTRIVRFPEMQNFIAQMQQEFFGLIPDAMAAVRYALQVEKNPAIGLRVLEATGVAAHRGAPLPLPARTPEDGYTRQAVMVANVLLEAHDQMGVDLGPEIEKALEKDARECAEAAKTSGAKLRQ